jgi:hypothetical protein
MTDAVIENSAVDPQPLIDLLQTDFEVLPGEVDMLFLDLPDTGSLPVSETVADASKPRSIRTDGLCAFATANMGEAQSSSYLTDYTYYMREFLPKDFLKKVTGKGAWDADALAWYMDWANSMEVKIVRAPEHGEMVIVDDLSIYPSSYRPDKNFVGKDRVEVLVTAKDYEGRSVSKKLVLFINQGNRI